MTTHPTTFENIRCAAAALASVVVRTPVLDNADVNTLLGGRILLKAENFQRTGAFKIRGAYNRILNLGPEERARGTVSYSSGNHALGMARAAKMLGTSAIIVMPSDASAAKMAATRALGAVVVTFDRDTKRSADVVAQIQSQTGRIEVPPSAHGQVLAGGVTASDSDVRAAMRFAFGHFKIMIEQGGVVGLAAVLNGLVNITDRVVATVITTVITGGNIDTHRFSH